MYNREKAAEYAKAWALGRNPKYYNFDKLGGDCTNFISQCIFAGFGEMNYTRDTGWYFNSINDRAAAWSSVEFLHKFLTKNKGRGPKAIEKVIDKNLEIGDIIQLSFDGNIFGHSLLVVDNNPVDPLICTHSDDSLGRPLSSYTYKKNRVLKIIS
ncbi:hypothetical protein FACS189425_10360 [Clostridia bacterium]|nr:hypothetical protein FACS189425_10360 [Clostridia bacterium]